MSKTVPACLRPLSLLFILALWCGALAAGDATAPAGRRSGAPLLVTGEVLQAKISEAEGNPELDAKSRADLIALYRDSLSNLTKIDAHAARADAFAEIMRTAPQETDLVRQRTAALQAAQPSATKVADAAAGGVQIARDLKREEADLAAVQALRADIERQLAYQENRPTAIRQTLATAQEQQRAIAAALQSPPPADEPERLSEARRWSLETRYAALSTQIQALDQELLSLPMKWDLLAATRDEKTAKIGVKAKIVSYEWGEYIKRMKAGEHDAGLIGWSGAYASPDNFLGILLTCEAVGSSNFSRYCSQEFDALVLKAHNNLDPKERKSLYLKAQEVFKRDLPWSTIAHATISLPMAKEVDGLNISPFAVFDFAGVSKR